VLDRNHPSPAEGKERVTRPAVPSLNRALFLGKKSLAHYLTFVLPAA
jgi:hypothetical protein